MDDEKMKQALANEANIKENEKAPILPGGRIKSMVTEVRRRKRVHQMRETALFFGIAILLLCAEQALLRTASLLFVLLQAVMIGTGVVLFVVLVWRQKAEARQHE